MTKKTTLNLKSLYSLNLFVLLSREMHIFHNKPQAERESKYFEERFYDKNRERKWMLIK